MKKLHVSRLKVAFSTITRWFKAIIYNEPIGVLFAIDKFKEKIKPTSKLKNLFFFNNLALVCFKNEYAITKFVTENVFSNNYYFLYQCRIILYYEYTTLFKHKKNQIINYWIIHVISYFLNFILLDTKISSIQQVNN